MASLALVLPSRSRRWTSPILRLTFLLAGVTIHVGLMSLITVWMIRGRTVFDAWPTMGSAAILYLISQACRAFRLIVIIGDPTRSVQWLARAHFIGVAASFILPFKIGDLLRLSEIAYALRGPGTSGFWKSVLVIWIERVYDALPVCILLLYVTVGDDQVTILAILPIVSVLVLFIALTLVVFFVLPENLDGLTLFIARRYHGARAVKCLHLIDRLHHLIGDARHLLHRKHITLIALSAGIWGLEALVARLVLGSIGFGGLAQALLEFLSGALSARGAGHMVSPTAYSLLIGLPLLFLGLVCWYSHIAAGRWKSGNADAGLREQPLRRRNP